ncbi:hypothetical protein I7I48_06589 [Histoplasma ohiense]|nr:hypothetical protein I7I48_06589 [Histoplasma ohiense (nom. inval.)]
MDLSRRFYIRIFSGLLERREDNLELYNVSISRALFNMRCADFDTQALTVLSPHHRWRHKQVVLSQCCSWR